jgi:signal transduction histidine kinase
MNGNDARRMALALVTDTTKPPTPRHRRLRRGRFDLVEVADVITALICFAAGSSWLTTQSARQGHPLGPGIVALTAFLISAPLVLRTRFPLTAWIGSGLTMVGTAVLEEASLSPKGYVPVSLVVYGLCLYAVTVRCKPEIVIAAEVVTVLGAVGINARSAVAALFLSAIPLLLGVLVRTYRSSERRLAEQERRHSGERALLEERQRIARELHDVVAHHMSVIAIQAEAAPYKVKAAPPELIECFAGIRESALTGLTELRRVLGVLRTDRPDTAPQPGLADLDALLDSARSGGLSVTAAITGQSVPLPEGVDLSAYRILQEALSNAMRHAPGSQVMVSVTYRDDYVGLDVRNDAGSPVTTPAARSSGSGEPGRIGDLAGTGSGHGLIGMRERATMLGGSLHAGPREGGGFHVIAILPVTADSGKAVSPQ